MKKKLLLMLMLLSTFMICSCGKEITPKQITVTFLSMNDTVYDSQVIDENSTLSTLPSDPLVEGYDFMGWFIEDEKVTLETIFEVDTTVKGKFEVSKTKYTITYKLNPEEVYLTEEVVENSILEKPTDPTLDGHKFNSWLYKNNFYKFDEPVTKNMTITAYFKEDKPLLELAEYEAYYVIASPGENSSTEMNINYHTKNTKTSLEYTLATDTTFADATVVKGEGHYFDGVTGAEEVAFEGRNVYQVYLKDLTPDTKYIYRVNQGDDTYTETYSFVTAKPDHTTFVWISDVHYFGSEDGAKAVVSEKVIEKGVEINPNTSFVFNTGDNVDTGGNADDWDMYFTSGRHMSTLPVACVSGNHEYYQNATGLIDDRYFVEHFNNPQNGTYGHVGGSYYFIHGETLFIQLDTASKYMFDNQLAWLESVVLANPTKFVILGTHGPFERPNIDHSPELVEVCERLCIDLVLTGHWHGDYFGKNKLSTDSVTYENFEVNNDMGVTYATAAGGGTKGYPESEAEKHAKGYVVDIQGDVITMTYFNALGEVFATRTIEAKKGKEKIDETKENIMNSINATFNEETKTVLFNWSDKFYQNVSKIEVKEVNKNEYSKNVYILHGKVTRHLTTPLVELNDYLFNLVVHFTDGTTQTKEFEFKLKDSINITTSNITSNSATLTFDEVDASQLFVVEKYQVWINGELVSTVNALDSKYAPISSIDLTDLTAGNQKVVIKAIGYSQEIIYSDSIEFTI